MKFKAALVQMRVEGGKKRENLQRARKLIAAAAGAGARLALLPETMDLGWTHPASQSEAEPIPDGLPFQTLAGAAAESRIFVCAGLTESDGKRIFNSAVLIDPRGRLLARHRKVNELAIGQAYYAAGDRLTVIQTELGSVGLMICADAFARDRVLSRSLGYLGAEIILSPCAWAVPGEHDNAAEPYGDTWRKSYRPVAAEFSTWIVGTSSVGPINGGPWAGRKCIGCSLAVGPDGREVLQGPYGVDAETILYLDIEPVARPARGDSWMEYWKNRPESIG
ncbi:MAG TPA: carbon-nitrogen hydrolase family protein [bacterium]|uniref:(R)-stereoselective amidase n=1 Tax=candidate division TA06 bacterium ADurb.Bin417 TaxID=1852828 RepID=A0A1V5MJW3_UNCT6|nr:MAG: (R)-stereoselective amidase [candidate division TA06 bacterium ADurb.Bin417]HNQ34629.1 carbon-nitrogen hydrolase family protein [bacterium]HNS48308.1 carbon-nitrogen hydrolase family protein [bacterium]